MLPMSRRLAAGLLVGMLFAYVAVPALRQTDRILCICPDGHVAEEPASQPCCGDTDCDESENGCASCVDRPVFEAPDSAEGIPAPDAAVELALLDLPMPEPVAPEVRIPDRRPDTGVDPPRSLLSTVVLRL